MLNHVMLIDDSDPDLIYAEAVLTRAAMCRQITALGTAQEALDHLAGAATGDVDVILLDINMPEMSGFEFLAAYERLHADRKAQAVVVMLTSSPDPRDRERAFAHGCVKGYVTKPIDAASARHLCEVVAAARAGAAR